MAGPPSMRPLGDPLMLRSRFLRGWTPLLVLAALGLGRPARAEPNDTELRTAGEALFAQGKLLQDKGDYERACPKFAEVTRLLPGKIGALLQLAECYEAAGKIASAKTSYEAAERAATAAGDPRAAAAHGKSASLSPRVPRLTLIVPPALQALKGFTLQRDALDLGAPQWGDPLPLDPGRHLVSASAPGKKPWSTSVDLADGASVSVEIPPLADDTHAALAPLPPLGTPTPAPTVPPPSISASGGVRPWVWIVGGAGVALLGVATGFGVDGLVAKSALAEHCGPDYGSTLCKETTATYDPTADNARKSRGLAVFVGVGGAGAIALGAAVVGFAKASTSRTPRASRVQVIPVVGCNGAELTLQGGF